MKIEQRSKKIFYLLCMGFAGIRKIKIKQPQQNKQTNAPSDESEQRESTQRDK